MNGDKLNSESPYEAEPVDIWGVGVILFTLLVGSEHSYIYALKLPCKS